MALFGSAAPAAQAPGRTRDAGAQAAGLSIIGAGMKVLGNIETTGIVKIEGTVDGHVKAKQQVLVARDGTVHGDVETPEAVIGGTVRGAIRAGERVEIQAGATVIGDITTRRIAVAEGGSLNGQIKMGTAAVAAGHQPALAPPAPEVEAGSREERATKRGEPPAAAPPESARGRPASLR